MANCLEPVSKENGHSDLKPHLIICVFGTPEAVFCKTELFISIVALKHKILHFRVLKDIGNCSDTLISVAKGVILQHWDK